MPLNQNVEQGHRQANSSLEVGPGSVHHFLERRIGFLDISRVVEETLGTVPGGKLNNLDDVANADTEGRRVAEEIVARICG